MDARPRFIVIPAALEMTVDKLLAQIYPAQPDDAIVAVRGLTSIAKPRFDAKSQTGAWYLFADPAAAPVFEYAELSGYAGPQVEARQGFGTVGTGWCGMPALARLTAGARGRIPERRSWR